MKKQSNLKGKPAMIQAILCILFITLSIYFMLPLFSGILHIGMIYPTAFFLLCAFFSAKPQYLTALFCGKFKIISIIASVLIGAFVISVLSTVIAMALKANDYPNENDDITVIVLGCQVNNETPSIMLNDRISVAYDYLCKNKNAKCIASGGQGKNESISEAECIKRGLIERGIDESRIFVEDKSTTTFENLKFSAEIISESGLSKNVAVASDNFHQLRAYIFASRQGLRSYSLGRKTFWVLSGGYWAREVLGIFAALIRGY